MIRRVVLARDEIAERAETLLRSIAGIVEARVTPRGDRIGQVEVRVNDDLPAGEVVRIVETALLAWMRVAVEPSAIFVDRAVRQPPRPSPLSFDRFIPNHAAGPPADGSNHATPAVLSAPAAPLPAGDFTVPRKPPRLRAVRLVRLDEETVVCRVVLDWDGSRVSGEAQVERGEDASLWAAGAAVLEALRGAAGFAAGPWALDGVKPVDVGRIACVVASVRLRRDWEVLHFPGAAVLRGAPERAAAAATLRAVTRAVMAGERSLDYDQVDGDLEM